MNCNLIKSKLGSYIDRTISHAEIQEIEEHLDTCPECSQTITTIKHIDALGRRLMYSGPLPEYWKTLPKTITNRLGLRAETNLAEKLTIIVNEFFVSKTLRWGLTGALAALGLIFIFKEVYRPEKPKLLKTNEKESVSLSSEIINSKKEIEDERKVKQIEPGKEKSLTIETAKIAEKNSLENEPTLKPESITGEFYGRIESPIETPNDIKEIKKQTVAKGKVDRMQPRKQKFELSYAQELVPIPPELLFSDNEYLEDSKEKTKIRVPESLGFQLGQNVQAPQQQQNSKSSKEFEEAESSFAETLWIVQQSRTLSEKRNIWLSYISREKDPTYRSLGIYNLALVLSKQAEESKDPEKAMEALTFYTEHEKSLVVQMGPKRYQMKMDVFKMIINRTGLKRWEAKNLKL